ncbi:MAG: hypothetical protein ABSG29_05265 [Steroidobacteraceae bacterium]|jgi:hypothetical protein
MKFVIAAVCLMVVLAWARLNRYEYAPVAAEGLSGLYIRDRWTGELKFCRATHCAPVRDGW